MIQILFSFLQKTIAGKTVKSYLLEVVFSIAITFLSVFLVRKFIPQHDSISRDEVQKLLENQRQKYQSLEIKTDSLNYILIESFKREKTINEKVFKIDSLQRLSFDAKFDYVIKRARSSR